MESIRDYIDVVLEPWQIAQRAESVTQALALIEKRFGIIFKQVEFEVIEDNDGCQCPHGDEKPTDPSEDGEDK